MADWKSRLEVRRTDTQELVTPITSFSTTLTIGISPIHSIEADNVGVIKKNQTMTFSMTVPPIGAAAANLYKLAIAGTPFDVQLAENDGTDWSFKKLLFRNCYITSATPSTVNVNSVTGLLDTPPIATFSGIVKDFNQASDIELP
jgi:hypothetical protein